MRLGPSRRFKSPPSRPFKQLELPVLPTTTILKDPTKLTDLKVVYICPDHNEKYHQRKVYMETLLHNIGFTDIVHYKSSSENYPACLVNANIDILQTYMDVPFLLLEDDVEFTGIHTVELPPEADAIYLGLSAFAGSRTENYHDGCVQHAPYSATQKRVLNMLATHAILYITPRYKQAVIDILKQYKDTPYYNDVLMSRIQPNYMVLAQSIPCFFQSSKFNKENQEAATKITLI